MPSSQRLSSFLFELIFVLFPLPFLLLPCELDPDFGEVAASSSGTGLYPEEIEYKSSLQIVNNCMSQCS